MPFLIFLGSGAMLLGLAHLIWMIVTKRRSQGIANWPSVEGQVLAAAVSTLARETPEGIRRTHTPVITYAYEVAGQAPPIASTSCPTATRPTRMSPWPGQRSPLPDGAQVRSTTIPQIPNNRPLSNPDPRLTMS